jgi:hypothetical protein
MVYILLPEAIRPSFENGISKFKRDRKLFSYDYGKSSYYLSRLIKQDRIVMKSLEFDFNRKLSMILEHIMPNDILLVIAGFGINRKNLKKLNNRKFLSLLCHICWQSRYTKAMIKISCY